MLPKSRSILTAAVAAATAGTALAQAATTTGTTLTTVLSSTPTATTSVTSLLLGPFGGAGVIHASVMEADGSTTVFALGCDASNTKQCDIAPFTVTEGDKNMHIVTSYIGAPMVADYSCTYSALASTDTLSCVYTTTTSSTESSALTTEYVDPSLYFSPVTITAGLELLESASVTDAAEPSVTAEGSDGVSGDDSTSGSTSTTGRGSGSGTTSLITSESSTQTNNPVGVNAGNSVLRGSVAAALLGAVAAGFAMI